MRGYKIFFTLSLVMVLMVSMSATVFALSRDELNKYKEEVLMGPDFSLKATDGKTYSLADYKGKSIVVVQTGSST